jgi:hypothetical protein
MPFVVAAIAAANRAGIESREKRKKWRVDGLFYSLWRPVISPAAFSEPLLIFTARKIQCD